ncbi:cupin domain-containing protein [Occallatibacter riparius]|uniref:Cupin domain-containing protein n=1 Tax=Occallatibacter riparius TaxID=1002689 RepID=A0A9J7BW67_9BACT|nr:cupin domain-containing protein [Occallatibacter riparius]UWZ86888.1 cupin domain-containing protein [Occallatibacter riparius]
MYEVILKRFDNPDEIRTFEKGKFELVHIGGMTIGRATYEPGWKWSEHVGRALGKKSCEVEHVGMVISGCATAAMDDGRIIEMHAGDLFFIEPGHDSWVAGNEPYVSIHLMGAARLRRQEVIPTSASQRKGAIRRCELRPFFCYLFPVTCSLPFTACRTGR